MHTGDLADNIKLKIQDRINSYCKGVKELVEGLEKNDSKVYYLMGNHDDYEVVSQFTKKGEILEEGLLPIDNLTNYSGDYYKNIHLSLINFYDHRFVDITRWYNRFKQGIKYKYNRFIK